MKTCFAMWQASIRVCVYFCSRMRTAILFTIATAASVNAQGVGINSTGAAADASAMLDVSSTTRGMLVPRMTGAQRAAIATPATGLIVYQTDAPSGFYYNAGTPATPNWVQLISNATGGASQWTTNGSDIYITTEGTSGWELQRHPYPSRTDFP